MRRGEESEEITRTVVQSGLSFLGGDVAAK